ncbi:hypothetical protein R1sor_023129 [Riccia sorocarpa]|uniref:Reverse transcriptase domain-containing protein n=1 Tax=Riccia sorocarpa TaxID=122646 RepID=A0ABD3GLV9_9MARC
MRTTAAKSGDKQWQRNGAEYRERGGGGDNLFVKLDFTKAFDKKFSNPVIIKRGVSQGCPLIPLLFAMSMWPLMRAFRKEEESGTLQEIQLPRLKSVLHELFAVDTSLFIDIRAQARDFQKARAVTEKFETAYGASLNMQKFMVMALGAAQNSGWIWNIGCDHEVVGDRRPFKFLRVWIGRRSTQLEVTEKAVEELR